MPTGAPDVSHFFAGMLQGLKIGGGKGGATSNVGAKNLWGRGLRRNPPNETLITYLLSLIRPDLI